MTLVNTVQQVDGVCVALDTTLQGKRIHTVCLKVRYHFVTNCGNITLRYTKPRTRATPLLASVRGMTYGSVSSPQPATNKPQPITNRSKKTQENCQQDKENFGKYNEGICNSSNLADSAQRLQS